MSDYSNTFTESTGDTIDTTDFSTEFSAIETAIATKADSSNPTINGSVLSTLVLNTKILEIGDWDMDATTGVTVAHGLTLANIMEISAVIRTDAATAHISFIDDDALAGGVNALWADATLIHINRTTGGRYDSTAYNQTSFNRGFIVVKYIS